MSICKRLGLIPLRDGSITGLEYATIPHRGIKGVAALKESIEVLKNIQNMIKIVLSIFIWVIFREQNLLLLRF